MSDQDSNNMGSSFYASSGFVIPEPTGEKPQGSEGEKAKQLAVAGQLERALSFIRSTARTNDYFTGYSLNEIIQERIQLIGENNKETTATVGNSKKLTLIATLNDILLDLVGEGPKYEGGSIQEALDMKAEPVEEEEDYESFND